MPSERGLILVGASLSFFVAARILGIPELYEIGVGLAVLLLAGLLLVHRSNQRITARRRLAPSRVVAGGVVRVEIVVRNRGTSSSEALFVADEVPEPMGGNQRFALTPIEPGGVRTLSYELAPKNRGKFEIGPARISFADPFALARSRIPPIQTSQLVVYPYVEDLAAPGARADRPSSGSTRAMGAHHRGEEFFTMREYQRGDDLRKIHWASTARTGRIMIRQEELQRQVSAAVVLDDGIVDDLWAGQLFDRAVSSAASLFDHYVSRNLLVGLFFASDLGPTTQSSFSRGAEHFHRQMSRLAVAQPSEKGDAASLLVRLRRARLGEGTIAVVTSRITEVGAVMSAAPTGAEKVVVFHPPYRTVSGGAPDLSERRAEHALTSRGIKVLVVKPGETLGTVWNRAVKVPAYGGRA